MADPRIDALTNVPLFAGLPMRHLRSLVRGAVDYSYAQGNEVVQEGREGETLFVILEGRARAVRRGRTLRRLSPGDHFGEIALLDRRPRSATVVAETPLRCMVLHREDLRKLIAREPKAAWALLVSLASRLRGD